MDQMTRTGKERGDLVSTAGGTAPVLSNRGSQTRVLNPAKSGFGSPRNNAFATADLRNMPESLSAEAAVLGSMIIDPECIGLVVEQLSTEAFYRIEHRYIFDALITLYEKNKGEAIDAVLLRNELESHKQLEEVGGVEYLARIIDSVPSSANVMY